MTTQDKDEKRHYRIMVFGIEKKGLAHPDAEIKTPHYTLFFEPYNTKKRFSDFDGVIFFQRIFHMTYGEYLKLDEDSLNKRVKEVNLVMEKGGFVCSLLNQPLEDGKELTHDLSWHMLNYNSFYKKDFGYKITSVKSKKNEFLEFISKFGAAESYFNNHNQNLELNVLMTVGDKPVGLFIERNKLFIPSLIPDNSLEQITEYFTLLAVALTSTLNKMVTEIPAWVNRFQFEEEKKLTGVKEELRSKIEEISLGIDTFQKYKRILLCSGDELVDEVENIFKNGFKFKTKKEEEYREDLQIIDENGEPILFCEIKGTNQGVKREYINQTDSHRERAELRSDFPSTLIINTHIKQARAIDEKDRKVASEQIVHAKKNNVLVMRTLDLIRLLNLMYVQPMISNKVLEILTNNVGWLEVTDEGYTVHSQ